MGLILAHIAILIIVAALMTRSPGVIVLAFVAVAALVAEEGDWL